MRRYLGTFGVLGALATGCASGASTAFGVGDGSADASTGQPDSSKTDATGGHSARDSGGSSSSKVDAVSIFPTDTGSGGDGAAHTDSSTGADSGPKQACVHNTDCTAANLCIGNNGLACLGGFCVPTNMPMNCDDGVPCTTDTCDGATNTCVHMPDDAACPSGEYCDPVMNCVTQLACTPGDGVCDRLDTSVCKGLYVCNPTMLVCVENPPPCPSRANATTSCQSTPFDGGVPADAGTTVDGGEIAADCSWACQTGYVDVDHDLNVPVGQMSDGCECMISNAVDLPDLAFTDTNCDGIDGTIADAVFVDTLTGNDTNPGTMAQPKKTITAGIALAETQASPTGFPSPHKDVYISMGTYDEQVSLVGGVGIYGGYDAATGWSRASTNETLIQGSSDTGILGQNVTSATTVQLFTVAPPAANAGSAGSTYGVRLISSSGPILIQGCTITPGGGGSGVDGANGAGGASGGNASGEGAGGSSCSAAGGPGGASVSGATGGIAGTAGETAPGGGMGGGGGSAGSSGTSCCSSGNGGNGGSGTSGALGGNGGDSSTTAATLGDFGSDGTYSGAGGAPGAIGGAGGGGGGGGSGGAADSGCPFSCGSNSSGNGGGGGGGGCGGTGGSGGAGGGGSFGVVSVGSTVTIDHCTITTGQGGAGGKGGTGAGGGHGGNGAGGAGGGTDSGSGGTGGNGAAGGTGGHGSGGTGGPSVCVLYSPTSDIPNYTNNNCIRSGGGAAGASGGGTAPAGLPGLDAEINGA